MGDDAGRAAGHQAGLVLCGRTWKEHADAEGHCCQPEGRQLEELPEDGQQKAKERLSGMT